MRSHTTEIETGYFETAGAGHSLEFSFHVLKNARLHLGYLPLAAKVQAEMQRLNSLHPRPVGQQSKPELMSARDCFGVVRLPQVFLTLPA